MQRKKFAVASTKAFVEKDGKILILRESPDYKAGSQIGKYVIPGGKVDEGEHFADALRREVKEECNVDIEVGLPFHTDEWRINIPDKPKHIVATYFHCPFKKGEVKLNGEFDKYEWINPKDFEKYPINEAAKRAFKTYIGQAHL